ncbi:MAG: ATP-binding protein [Ignavibacteria bacterium]|nr:ATP-binding protein [Ignavibacteria bacterium]
MPESYGKNTEKFKYLRQAAEEKLSDSDKEISTVKKYKPDDIKSLLYEIKVLQSALEIQTEELDRVQTELTGVYSNIVNFYENAPLGYMSVDIDGIIKKVNNFVISLLQSEKNEITGKPVNSFIFHEDIERYTECLRKNYLTRKNQKCEIRLVNAGHRKIHARLTISGVNEEFGKNSDYKIIIEDISPRKEAEEKLAEYEENIDKIIDKKTNELERLNRFLEQEKNYAEKLNRMKTVFLANISHELRTPLVGILGYSEIMMNELKDEEYVKMARRIQSSGTRLLETLNMILDFAKTETEKITLNIESVDTAGIVEDVTDLFRLMAEKKGLAIKVKGTGKPLYANIDERLFRQIVNNLVNNAVKYTNSGSVEINLKKEGSVLLLSVRDTGIGIMIDRIDKIFEEFGQVNESYNKGYLGSGLGLTLVKRYTTLMNGEIKVSSEYGKGTEFTVILPVEGIKAKRAPAGGYSPKSKKSHRILIVEDDELNYSLLRNFIEDSFEVSVATNLNNALDMAKQNIYNLILMDINLGTDETGIDVLREIRELEGYNRVPAIAVTAYSLKGDKDIFIRSGMNEYISKPFTKKELIRKIYKLLGIKN